VCNAHTLYTYSNKKIIMLLNKNHIDAVTSMDATALIRNGYPEDSVQTAVFKGMTPGGSFVYVCTSYNPHNDRIEDFNVYVKYDLSFNLIADY